MTSQQRTDRARNAHAAVRRHLEGRAEDWRKFRTIALKLPVMIHNEGLAPALHFVAARSEAAQRVILTDLARDLDHADAGALLAWSRGLAGHDLRVATRDVLRRLGWYKRVVQAYGREGQLAGSHGEAS